MEDLVGLRAALREARALAAEPWTCGLAIGVLEDAYRSLEPACDLDDPAPRSVRTERVRTLLSSHLLALRTLDDVGASQAAVAKVVRRAVDAAETALAAPASPLERVR